MRGALAPTRIKYQHPFRLLCLLMLATLISACDRAGPQIDKAVLDNGLTIYVMPHHRAPTLTHMVWYRTGGADDPLGQSGIAHLFEHLMFKSTTTRPEGDFSKTIARLGGEDNAMTMPDLTVYFQRVPKEHLEKVIALEADRMANLTLSQEDFDTERDVVIEERSLRVDSKPMALAQEQMMDALYAGHPYHIPVIGWRNELKNVPYQAAVDFYRAHYAPDQATLLVVGDTSLDEVVRLAQKHFGPLKPSGKPLPVRPVLNFDEPILSTEPLVFSDPRSQQHVWLRLYRLPSASTITPRDMAALTIGIDLLGGNSTSLLYDHLVRDRALVVDTGSSLDTNMRDSSEIMIYAIAHDDAGLIALDTQVNEIIQSAQNSLFSEEQIKRSANKLAAAFLYDHDGQSALAFNYGLAISFGADVDEISRWPDDLAAVTAEDIQHALTTYLVPGQYITGHIKPEGPHAEQNNE